MNNRNNRYRSNPASYVTRFLVLSSKPGSTDGFVGSSVWGRVAVGLVRVCGLARFGAFWGVRDWSAGLWRVGGAWGWAALRGALSGGSDEQGQVADSLQGGGEGVLPGPVERQGLVFDVERGVEHELFSACWNVSVDVSARRVVAVGLV